MGFLRDFSVFVILALLNKKISGMITIRFTRTLGTFSTIQFTFKVMFKMTDISLFIKNQTLRVAVYFLKRNFVKLNLSFGFNE